MKKSGVCPKCRGTDIVADAKAVDRGDVNSERDMEIATFRRPQALFFKERQQTTVSAWVCLECGYIEYYADDPARLRLPKH